MIWRYPHFRKPMDENMLPCWQEKTFGSSSWSAPQGRSALQKRFPTNVGWNVCRFWRYQLLSYWADTLHVQKLCRDGRSLQSNSFWWVVQVSMDLRIVIHFNLSPTNWRQLFVNGRPRTLSVLHNVNMKLWLIHSESMATLLCSFLPCGTSSAPKCRIAQASSTESGNADMICMFQC